MRRLGRVGGVRAAAAQTAAPRLVGVTERSSTSAAPSESRSGEAPPSGRPSADADASRRSARRRSMPGAPVSFLLRVHPLVPARHGHRWPAATPSARPRSRAPTSFLASLPSVRIMHVLGNTSPSGWGAHYIERSLVQTRDHVRCYKSAGSGCTRIDRIRSRGRGCSWPHCGASAIRIDRRTEKERVMALVQSFPAPTAHVNCPLASPPAVCSRRV